MDVYGSKMTVVHCRTGADSFAKIVSKHLL